MIRSLFKLAAFSFLVGSLTGWIPRPRPWLVRETYIMGTTLAISVSSGTRESSLQAIDSAFGAVHRVDDLLNDWRTDTDLARLNQRVPGRPGRVPAELREYLDEVAHWTRESNGAFDPGIGALVDAWDLRGNGRLPGKAELAAALKISGLLRFFPDSTTELLERPASASWIDAGGFGKGAALREAVNRLRSAGIQGGILNFGGQIAVMGDTTLLVDVAHPSHRMEPFARVRLSQASASTTSQSERFVEVGGRRFGHVVDPRTGIPVPAWGSVTVVYPDPMIADILSTALFVMGPEDGMRWLEGRGLAALFLVLHGDSVESRFTPAMQQLLITLPPQAKGN